MDQGKKRSASARRIETPHGALTLKRQTFGYVVMLDTLLIGVAIRPRYKPEVWRVEIYGVFWLDGREDMPATPHSLRGFPTRDACTLDGVLDLARKAVCAHGDRIIAECEKRIGICAKARERAEELRSQHMGRTLRDIQKPPPSFAPPKRPVDARPLPLEFDEARIMAGHAVIQAEKAVIDAARTFAYDLHARGLSEIQLQKLIELRRTLDALNAANEAAKKHGG